jgi:hypothetical protein
MKELDIAKIAYSKIIEAIDELNSDYEFRCTEPEKVIIGFPDSVTINGNEYRFQEKRKNTSITILLLL